MANVYNAVHHDDDSTTRKIYVPPSRFPVERQEVSVNRSLTSPTQRRDVSLEVRDHKAGNSVFRV